MMVIVLATSKMRIRWCVTAAVALSVLALVNAGVADSLESALTI